MTKEKFEKAQQMLSLINDLEQYIKDYEEDKDTRTTVVLEDYLVDVPEELCDDIYKCVKKYRDKLKKVFKEL